MLTLENLKTFCAANDIPAFRAKQIMQGIYQEGAETFSDISTLPAPLKKFLDEKAAGSEGVDGAPGIPGAPELQISTVRPIAQEVSSDNSTMKILFELPDKSTIEGVLMRFNDGRRTVCISSEVGCPLKCSFCASGTLRFKRSLSWEEMADQVIYFSKYLKRMSAQTGEKEELNHVVYMGIGEPFRNYDNLLKSLNILMDPQYVGLGARKITVSTAGIVEKIRQFADEPFQVNLALSLHAPTQELRQKIMPIALRYKLDDLMDAVRYYLKTTKRRISFEYVMLRDVNDTEECAHQLAKLVKGMLCHVNLIPYNATDIDTVAGSERKTIKKFQDILNEAGIPATTRVSLGQDIAAACGQLANKAQKPVEKQVAKSSVKGTAKPIPKPAAKPTAKPVAKTSGIAKLAKR
ncbi:MAG: 23S rRNA (adenine(2503)-C(2))-methyltransferase RlmN [Candidatus Gracilibacteria bacterium]